MGIDRTNPMPLYYQIVLDIKSQITSGMLREGDQLDTQVNLALHYNVSLITIKKALSKLVNDGLLLSRMGKGTFVTKFNKRIDYSESITIGLVLRDLDEPFFSKIVKSVEQQATELGYNILLKSTLNSAENSESQIYQFQKLGVKGLIIASMAHIYIPTPAINMLHDENFPYVMVSYVDDPRIFFVGTNHEMGGFIATEYLIKLGYEAISYVNGEKGNIVGNLRQNGYERALRKYGKTVNPDIIFRLSVGGFENDYNSGYIIGKQFAENSNRPQAVFLYDDLTALGFQRAILDAGLKVPEDVAIVGFDGIQMGETAPVPLTTILQPTDKIGHAAIDIITNQMSGKSVKSRTIFKPKLIIRQSCGGADRT
ncbi:MAG: GntR family transcriptional regulator [Candidatus Marinimicrobia bacterium]|nr:GntR family transcriptional regulator [Candidatus Neomarinimicrobiota bacterium]